MSDACVEVLAAYLQVGKTYELLFESSEFAFSAAHLVTT